MRIYVCSRDVYNIAQIVVADNGNELLCYLASIQDILDYTKRAITSTLQPNRIKQCATT